MMWKFLAILTVFSGCASAPAVRHPDIGIEKPARESSTDATPIAKWWTHLGDAHLDSLVDQALQSNFNLQTAAARLAQAEAQARIAGASLQPSIGLGGSGTRRKQNFIGFPIPGNQGQVLSNTTNSYGVSLSSSWELDLWGGLRAGTRAAKADAQAAQAELYGARLSVAAQTARAYVAAVEAKRQVELARATVDNYRVSNEQIDSRYERGLSASLELRLGRSNLAVAEATLEQRRQQWDRTKRQLEILLGRYPSGRIETGDRLPAAPSPAPADLSAELVRRRPDLIAAERRLAAADSRLLQARRQLLPRISLTASTGTSSDELSNLLSGDFSVWNMLANISQPLLQGGRLRAGVDMAQAGVDASLATYAQSALLAYAEVEQALIAADLLARQEKALQTATTEAQAARTLAEDRYAKGLSDLITLLDAQRRAFDAESRLLSVRRLRLDARIDLHLALGGDFNHTPLSSHSAENTR
ncbi:MAG: efflux transporter outer membrane subunit [Candidatus Latescibacterota bacterium]|nr:efflux transporter outer membrane subunit [Candidatus Latescibacterota bacterium]MEE2726497.1 efflux transporter outer membrane subunit [Candidatus Latescibacterota bacterium]